MAEHGTAASLFDRAGAISVNGIRRALAAWSRLDSHQRLAAAAAIALPVTMLLPWFQVTGTDRKGDIVSYSLTGFGSFTFAEAAILLVCGGVLWMLFARGEGRAFHLPGGDGGVIALAGGWCIGLITWRIIVFPPRPDITGNTGIEWGVMVSLAVAAAMLGAGLRLRAVHLPEPPIVFPSGDGADTDQMTIEGEATKPVIPAPEPDQEPDTGETPLDPTVQQLSMPLDDRRGPSRRSRRKRRQ